MGISASARKQTDTNVRVQATIAAKSRRAGVMDGGIQVMAVIVKKYVCWRGNLLNMEEITIIAFPVT